MLPLLKRYKPGGKIATHLLLSALLWSGIGLFLLYRGIRLEGALSPYFLAGAVLAGTLKSSLVLDHRARQAISRIRAFPDSTCLGAVYSLKTWILVLCMIAAGGILRSFSLPVLLLCFLYLTLGWALLWSSRLAWAAWFKGLESR
jgi:hypothetical protein